MPRKENPIYANARTSIGQISSEARHRKRLDPLSAENPLKIKRRMLSQSALNDVMSEKSDVRDKAKTKQSLARIPDKESAVRSVTVACKLPNGVILQCHEFYEKPEPGPAGIRTVRESRAIGPRYWIRGNRVPFATTPDYTITNLDNGYALTPNIPKDFWDKWCELNMNERTCPNWRKGKHVYGGCSCNDMVRTGLLFAAESVKSVLSEATEKQEIKSRFEPINPSKPPMRQVGTDESVAERLGVELTEPKPIRQGVGNAEAMVGSERDPNVSAVLAQG